MSVTFGKCPDCKDGRSVRLWGTGTCYHHFKNPPKKGDKASKATVEEVKAIAYAVLVKPTKQQLDAWFLSRAYERPRVCEEPGCSHELLAAYGWQMKATICHIVPKRHFWSVALHPLNRLYLCKTPHHDDYDSSWDKATQMHVWPLAVERFQVFMHLITDTELRFLPPALRELTNR